MPATAKQIEKFLTSLEPAIARAFREAVEAMRSRANISQLEAAIAAMDYERAFAAAGLRDYSWVQVPEATRAAYAQAGAFTIASDVPKSFGLSFNINNPRARDWIAAHSSRFVTEVNLGQQRAIRAIITTGFEQGRNPRNVALDIVGRVSNQTGRRTGGVIGLHEQFAEFAINARDQLTNLDPGYFARTRRDRRFDSVVRRAIDSGSPLTQSQIDVIVGSYENRLLQTRATNIARTEALTSLNEAADEALRQVVDEGLAPPDAIKKIWDATLDQRTRPTHAEANGQEVGMDEPFFVGGYAMMHPGDENAPPDETINCRCVVRHKVDFSKVD